MRNPPIQSRSHEIGLHLECLDLEVKKYRSLLALHVRAEFGPLAAISSTHLQGRSICLTCMLQIFWAWRKYAPLCRCEWEWEAGRCAIFCCPQSVRSTRIRSLNATCWACLLRRRPSSIHACHTFVWQTGRRLGNGSRFGRSNNCSSAYGCDCCPSLPRAHVALLILSVARPKKERKTGKSKENVLPLPPSPLPTYDAVQKRIAPPLL